MHLCFFIISHKSIYIVGLLINVVRSKKTINVLLFVLLIQGDQRSPGIIPLAVKDAFSIIQEVLYKQY